MIHHIRPYHECFLLRRHTKTIALVYNILEAKKILAALDPWIPMSETVPVDQLCLFRWKNGSTALGWNKGEYVELTQGGPLIYWADMHRLCEKWTLAPE